MTRLVLHDRHEAIGASFEEVNGVEVVSAYGDPAAEYEAVARAVGLIDLSCRGRLGLAGADRLRFLNGQVTNNVRDLQPGEGCYAALVNAKGRLQGDLNIYCLEEELLLDVEPGYVGGIAARLGEFIVADDVQVVDLTAEYGLLSLQGPRAAAALRGVMPGRALPEHPWNSVTWVDGVGKEICVVNQPRGRAVGYELFVSKEGQDSLWQQLAEAVRFYGGRWFGWNVLEWIRVEAGLPRFGQDMDERHLAPEAGIGDRAISYTKGCYIGQEVISRIRSRGQVTRSIQGLELSGMTSLPRQGDRLFREGREVGYITSAILSPALGRPIALGYVRREVSQTGAVLEVHTESGTGSARLTSLPFQVARGTSAG